MPNQFDTVEAAQAEILRLNGRITELETERDVLSQDKETLAKDLDKSRKLNQDYFNQLSVQYSQDKEEEEEEEEALSCEDFARTLDI